VCPKILRPLLRWGIHHGVCGILSMRIQCAITLISQLSVAFYGLELHHLTPSGILQMAAFVTLCEAYMGIEPHFDLWNYFFRVWLQQGSNVETVALGSVDILVQSGLGVDPYFHLPMSDPPIGWHKIWIFQRNDVLRNWGYGAQTGHHRLQTLWEVIWRLLRGITDKEILQTFFSRRIQQLHQC
jgi:hypothetical protein